MEILIRRVLFLLALSSVLFLAGCGTSGGSYSGSSTVVYSGYGYPHYRYGYCCYDDDDHDHRPDRPNRPDHPVRPDRPLRPTHPIARPERPSFKPMTRPAGGMGRPSGAGMKSRPARVSRGAGARRR